MIWAEILKKCFSLINFEQYKIVTKRVILGVTLIKLLLQLTLVKSFDDNELELSKSNIIVYLRVASVQLNGGDVELITVVVVVESIAEHDW